MALHDRVGAQCLVQVVLIVIQYLLSDKAAFAFPISQHCFLFIIENTRYDFCWERATTCSHCVSDEVLSMLFCGIPLQKEKWTKQKQTQLSVCELPCFCGIKFWEERLRHNAPPQLSAPGLNEAPDRHRHHQPVKETSNLGMSGALCSALWEPDRQNGQACAYVATYPTHVRVNLVTPACGFQRAYPQRPSTRLRDQYLLIPELPLNLAETRYARSYLEPGKRPDEAAT